MFSIKVIWVARKREGQKSQKMADVIYGWPLYLFFGVKILCLRFIYSFFADWSKFFSRKIWNKSYFKISSQCVSSCWHQHYHLERLKLANCNWCKHSNLKVKFFLGKYKSTYLEIFFPSIHKKLYYQKWRIFFGFLLTRYTCMYYNTNLIRNAFYLDISHYHLN